MENQTFKERIAGVVVGGDLNTNHDTQFGDKVIEMLTDAGFVNTWAGVPKEQRHTWMGSDRYDPTTFDYILTRGLKPSTAQLMSIDEAASDHRPLKLELELP
jgi:endonuclease/exonuclease/phosphatase family metal-dependent hydrolase